MTELRPRPWLVQVVLLVIALDVTASQTIVVQAGVLPPSSLSRRSLLHRLSRKREP